MLSKFERKFSVNKLHNWSPIGPIATASVNKYLNVNFTYIGIGDMIVVDGWQSASGLGVGLLVEFDAN
jgi:hypothetical protein